MPALRIDVEARWAQVSDALDQIARKADSAAGAMNRSFGALKGTLATLGVGLSVAGLVAFAKSSLDAVAALDDLSEKTSLSVETLSSLKAVAIIGGHALDDVANGASKFAKSVSGALGGNKELIQLFKQLGITVEDLRNQSFDEIFVRFGTVIAGAADKTNALAIAQKLAGKGAAENLPFFNDLAERGLRVATVTTEMAAEAEKLQKNFAALALRSQDTRDAIVGRMLPALIALTEEFKKAVAEGDNLLVVLAKTFSTAFGGNEGLQRDRQFIDNVNRKLRLERQIAEIEAGINTSLAARNPARLKALKDELNVVNLRVAALQKEREEIEKTGAKPAKPPGATVGPVFDRGEADKAEARAEAARKALADLTATGAKLAVTAEQAGAKERLSILDHFYKEGYAAEATYWEVRQGLQKAAYDTERALVQQNIDSRQSAVSGALSKHGKASKEYYDALKDLAEAQAQRNTLDAAFNAQGNQDVLSRAKATEDYERALKNVNIQLDQLRGNTSSATAAQFDQQFELLRRQAESRGDTAGLAQISTLRDASVAQAQFNELRERASEITARLALEEERIQNSQRTGAISELDALRRTDTARRLALQSLQLTQIQLDEIARSSGLEKLTLDAERFKVSLETLASQADLIGDKFKKTFEDAFTDEFAKIIDGTQSVTQAFKNMASNIMAELAKIQARSIAQSISSGDFFKSGVDIIKGILGGVGGGGGGLSDTDWGFAKGIDYVPFDMITKVHKGEKITTAAENRGGSDGVTVIIKQDNRGADSSIFGRLMAATDKLRRDVPAIVDEAIHRGVTVGSR